MDGCQRQLRPRNICQLDYEIYFWFLSFFPVLADSVFWLTAPYKCSALQTADLDSAGVSFPKTERVTNAKGSSSLIYQEACLFTNCTQ